MSIIRALQDWLAGFGEMEIRPLTEIKTDRPEECPSSYALAPTGNNTVSVDITGRRTYQHSYMFLAKESASDEIDRQENYDFLDALNNWMEEQNDIGRLPSLPGRYHAKSLEVSNYMMLDLYDDGTGLYQIQIQLEFYKE